MEHRAHPRYAAGVEAVVEHRWLGHVRGRIRDVNATGIFVDLPPTTDLKPIAAPLSSSQVTVRYRLPRGPAGRSYVWRGYVARIGESGLGASITNPRTDGDPNLNRLVEYARRTEERQREVKSASSSR